jgi:NAD(P)-dependent dehydrogenase (short-subunit alcohol dehydrogenase family)
MADGPRCLVLGGSGVLGRAVCEALSREGAHLAFTYNRNRQAADAVLKICPSALALPLDLLSLPSIESRVEEAESVLGGLDAFVQCAGVAITVETADPRAHHLMGDVDDRAWGAMFDVNVRSTFFAARRAAAAIGRSGGGNIVLVGSIDGIKAAPAPVHYAASKGALAGMVPAMGKELGKQGIRVNMVAPGILEGGISDAIPDDLRAQYLKHCGLKRLGRPAEIANVIAWFATRNTYVTGQTILVDGAL